MPALPSSVGFAECTSQSCLDTTSSLLSYIDHNVDPCDNFYQYSCGAWLKSNTVPSYSGSSGSFGQIDLEIKDNIITVLNGSYEDLLQLNLAPDFIEDPYQANDEEVFDKLKTFYETCMDTETIDKLGPAPIYPLLASIEDTQNITELLVAAGQVDIWPFVRFHIEGDPRNPDETSIWPMPPVLTLTSPSYYAITETLQLYQTQLVELLSGVLAPNETSSQEAARKANLTLVNQQDIPRLVERFIAFEAQISRLTANAEADSLSVASDFDYDPQVPISSLQTSYPFVSWSKYLGAFVPEGRALPGSVLSYYPVYMNNITTLLQAADTKTIHEFVAIKAILAFADSLDTPTSKAYMNMLSSLVYGTIGHAPRDQDCAGRVQSGFDRAVARYLIMTTLGGSEERDRVIEMADNTQQTWIHRIETLDWLDNQTRASALDKIKKTAHWITYSLKSPNLRSSTSVRDYYRSFEVTSLSLFANAVTAARFSGAYKTWQDVGVPRQKTELTTQQWAVANSFYLPTQNMIAILPGILRAPAYVKDGPLYANYGAIGFIIAHEFSHGFDSIGRAFDAEGRYTDWWTNTTTQLFTEKAACYINQYSNYTVPGPNNTVITVNGELTLSENIADNAGLSISYETFQGVWKNTTKSVPGTTLTPDQLFFVSQAHFFCANINPGIALLGSLTDTHSPPEWRVNGAMQNSEAFSNVFQCAKKTNMNPEKKCVMW